jgi:DNA polymerase-3 subunit delta
MLLNLNNFLTTAFTKSSGVLLSAPEESAVILNFLREQGFLKLADNYLRCSYAADRYFQFALVEDIIRSNSLFGDRNWIEVNFKTKPTIDQQQQLINLLPLLDESNYLIISCDKLDKKDQSSTWFKKWNENADSLLLSASDGELRQWTLSLLDVTQLKLESAALDLLLEMNQSNPAQLHQEVIRLGWLFPKNTTISYAELKALLLDNSQFTIFALSNNYLRGDISAAKKIYAQAVQATEDAILLIWQLGEDLRKLIRIKSALRSNPDFRAAVADLRIWGDSIAPFNQAQQRLSYQLLLTYLDELARIDGMVKGIIVGDPLIKLEQLIINICRGV